MKRPQDSLNAEDNILPEITKSKDMTKDEFIQKYYYGLFAVCTEYELEQILNK
jgi:hypothetical protein